MRVKFDKHRDMVKYLLQNASFNFKYMGDMWDIEVADLKKINGAMIKNSLIDAKASNASFAKTRRGIAVFKWRKLLRQVRIFRSNSTQRCLHTLVH